MLYCVCYTMKMSKKTQGDLFMTANQTISKWLDEIKAVDPPDRTRCPCGRKAHRKELCAGAEGRAFLCTAGPVNGRYTPRVMYENRNGIVRGSTLSAVPDSMGRLI